MSFAIAASVEQTESCHNMLHPLPYFVIAEIAYTAFVGVVNIAVSFEGALFDGRTDLPVCFTEWNAPEHSAVYLFNTEYGIVFGIDIISLRTFMWSSMYAVMVGTLLYLIESRQEYLLDKLHVAEVAAWQIVRDQRYLLRDGLDAVAFGTRQFKDIGVLFVRHNAGARGTVIGQLYESKFWLLYRHAS